MTTAACASRFALGVLVAASVLVVPAMATELPGSEGAEALAAREVPIAAEDDVAAEPGDPTEAPGEPSASDGEGFLDAAPSDDVLDAPDGDDAQLPEDSVDAPGSTADDPALDDGDAAGAPADGLPSDVTASAEADSARQVEDAVLQAAQTGAFAVEGGAYGTDYRYQNGILTVLTSTPITITMAQAGTTTSDAIEIVSSSPANVTLQNVSIDCSGTGSTQTYGTAAFDVRSGGVNLTIAGQVTLKSGSLQAGLQTGSTKHSFKDTASYPIVLNGGSGSLYVYGGYNGAGIGTGYGTGCSAGITINGGFIHAYGGEGAAGIGGAAGAWGTNISVAADAHVYALGGSGGAGIGGGQQQYGKDLTFSAGTVEARGGNGGAGIGNGSGAFVQADAILIEGTATVLATGGNDAAAIGGGKGSGLYDCVVTGGYLMLKRGNGDTEAIGHGDGNRVSGSTLMGGYFVEGSHADGTVYGLKVASGYQVEYASEVVPYHYHVVPSRESENPVDPVGPADPANPENPENPENPTPAEKPSAPAQSTNPAQTPVAAKPTTTQVPKTGDVTPSPFALAAAGAAVLGVVAGLLARLRGLKRKLG